MSGNAEGFGCAAIMLVFNALAIGVLALSFALGPYSSLGQEIWYRYGSLSFLLAGVVLPGAALVLYARRRRRALIGLTLWMIVVLVCFYGYIARSGGGV